MSCMPFFSKCSYSSLRIPFMNCWKLAGELLIPKNITLGLNSPQRVLNAAFH